MLARPNLRVLRSQPTSRARARSVGRARTRSDRPAAGGRRRCPCCRRAARAGRRARGRRRRRLRPGPQSGRAAALAERIRITGMQVFVYACDPEGNRGARYARKTRRRRYSNMRNIANVPRRSPPLSALQTQAPSSGERSPPFGPSVSGSSVIIAVAEVGAVAEVVGTSLPVDTDSSASVDADADVAGKTMVVPEGSVEASDSDSAASPDAVDRSGSGVLPEMFVPYTSVQLQLPTASAAQIRYHSESASGTTKPIRHRYSPYH